MNFSKISHTPGIGRSSVKPREDKASRILSSLFSSKNDLTHAFLVIVASFPPQSVPEIAWRPKNAPVLASSSVAAGSFDTYFSGILTFPSYHVQFSALQLL